MLILYTIAFDILIHSRSIVVLVVIILQCVAVQQGVALVWDVTILAVLHRHVDLLSILSLLHVERGVSIVESGVFSAGKTLHWSHCLVLGVKNLRDIGLQFLLL